MKRFDLSRWAPATIGHRVLLGWAITALLLCSIASLLGYADNIAYLKRFTNWAVSEIPPLEQVVYMAPLELLPWLCAGSILFCYASHFGSSKSIYVMRRLPRWELVRRCATIPLLTAAAGALVYWLILCFCRYNYPMVIRSLITST